MKFLLPLIVEHSDLKSDVCFQHVCDSVIQSEFGHICFIHFSKMLVNYPASDYFAGDILKALLAAIFWLSSGEQSFLILLLAKRSNHAKLFFTEPNHKSSKETDIYTTTS